MKGFSLRQTQETGENSIFSFLQLLYYKYDEFSLKFNELMELDNVS